MGQVINNLFQGLESFFQEGSGKTPADLTSCDLVLVIQNVIVLMWQLSFFLGTIYVVYGGFLILTAGGNETKVEDGRKAITAAVVGIVIALSAWLIVNTLINFLAGNATFIPWNKLSC